jgi:hypothetical protein
MTYLKAINAGKQGIEDEYMRLGGSCDSETLYTIGCVQHLVTSLTKCNSGPA